MGVQQSVQQSSKADRELLKNRSVSLVAKIKERSASFETRGDYVVGTGHYVLQPNVRVEAYDTWRSNLTNTMVFRWRPARILKVRDDSVLVAFDGFSERWDTWLPLSEGKVRSPSGGPVTGPDGILYPPRNTPEPLPSNSVYSSWAAAPLHVPATINLKTEIQNDEVPLPRGSTLQHSHSGKSSQTSRTSGLTKLRVYFKKTSRSDDDEDPDDEFDSAREDDGLNDVVDRERHVRIDLENQGDDNGEGRDDEKSIEGKTFENAMLARIQRTISSTSSLVVETGDVPPTRVPTPPLGFTPFPFLRRSHGESGSNKSNKYFNATSNSMSNSSVDVTLETNNESPPIAVPAPVANKENRGSILAPPVSKAVNSNRGLSGLLNLGNTCYMNAVLQSLSHVAPLVVRMLSDVKPLTTEELSTPPVIEAPQQQQPKRAPMARNDRLARVFCTLVRDQWRLNPEKTRKPEALKKIISDIAPQFQGNRQQDAQELLVCLLDGLHECLNRIRRRPTYVEINPSKDLSEEELAFLYWDNYERGNDSFIKDLFCGQLMSRVTCGDCGVVSTSFDVFWDLSLHVPQQEKAVQLQDLLTGFCEVETMTEDCGFKCESCKKPPSTGATKQLSIAKRPKVLVLHLKRFSHEKSGTRKIITPVSFPMKGLKDGDETYDLAAVVNHVGSFASGHYTADVYNPTAKSWYHADDANITATTRVGVNAYLLFYVEASQGEDAVRNLLLQV